MSKPLMTATLLFCAGLFFTATLAPTLAQEPTPIPIVVTVILVFPSETPTPTDGPSPTPTQTATALPEIETAYTVNGQDVVIRNEVTTGDAAIVGFLTILVGLAVVSLFRKAPQ